MTRFRLWSLLLVGVLLLAACGTVTTSTTVADSDRSDTTESTRVVSTLEDLRAGVVRIEAEGTFEYPSGTSFNEAGSGSGFFISDDGLIVTNNHVVAGAGRIKVHVEGESEAFNGRIVGTSECADLAVVDIDAEDRPYLNWTEQPISTGQEIFVAGFPLGDPEYTLIDGIISKETASGDSDWAAVDSVLEHTGDTLPGSSGGPIVNRDGQVLGVNYAGDDYGQAFGISAELARDIVENIISHEPTLSIGINGWAHEDDYGTGVWVASVVPDSPADRVGIQAGDFITQLAGLFVAQDGTLAEYCDILDSHSPDLPFDVQVWREDRGEYFEAVINSDQQLEVVEDDSILAGANGSADLEFDGLSAEDSYESFELVWDDTDEVSLELPVSWDDRLSGEWDPYDEPAGSYLMASSDLEAWFEGWGTPGVLVGVSSSLPAEGIDAEQFLADLEMDDCEFSEQIPYDDGIYVGSMNVWVDCGDIGSVFVDWAGMNPSGDTLISAQFTIVSEADLDAAVKALETLFLTADLDY